MDAHHNRSLLQYNLGECNYNLKWFKKLCSIIFAPFWTVVDLLALDWSLSPPTELNYLSVVLCTRIQLCSRNLATNTEHKFQIQNRTSGTTAESHTDTVSILPLPRLSSSWIRYWTLICDINLLLLWRTWTPSSMPLPVHQYDLIHPLCVFTPSPPFLPPFLNLIRSCSISGPALSPP